MLLKRNYAQYFDALCLLRYPTKLVAAERKFSLHPEDQGGQVIFRLQNEPVFVLEFFMFSNSNQVVTSEVRKDVFCLPITFGKLTLFASLKVARVTELYFHYLLRVIEDG